MGAGGRARAGKTRGGEREAGKGEVVSNELPGIWMGRDVT